MLSEESCCQKIHLFQYLKYKCRSFKHYLFTLETFVSEEWLTGLHWLRYLKSNAKNLPEKNGCITTFHRTSSFTWQKEKSYWYDHNKNYWKRYFQQWQHSTDITFKHKLKNSALNLGAIIILDILKSLYYFWLNTVLTCFLLQQCTLQKGV